MRTTINAAGHIVVPKCVETEPAPIQVRLVRRGRLTVAVAEQRVAVLTAEEVDSTRDELRDEQG